MRILRAARLLARFASLGFTIAPETLALMQQMAASGELDALVPERVWQELGKALRSTKPSAFLHTLRQVNALHAVLPEVDALYGVPQRVAITRKWIPARIWNWFATWLRSWLRARMPLATPRSAMTWAKP